MARVTALRERRGGRIVDVELDGAPWRALPLGAVVGAELRVGLDLDRPRLRELRRQLRRAEALAAATRALRHRDLPRAALEERLARRGVAEAPAGEAVEALERAGLVDDGRFADSRAQTLAERGLGDAAIRWDLERQGVDERVAARAIAALAPEAERAAAAAERRGRTPATARALARKGFSEEAIEAALGDLLEP